MQGISKYFSVLLINIFLERQHAILLQDKTLGMKSLGVLFIIVALLGQQRHANKQFCL